MAFVSIRTLAYLGLGLPLVACNASQQSSGSFAVAGFPVGGQKRTASASVQDEFVRGEQKPDCDRRIDVLDATQAPKLTYRNIASTSVRCDYRALEYCRRQLAERACDLGGDAVIVEEPAAEPNPTGNTPRSSVTQSGQVIKYDLAQAGR